MACLDIALLVFGIVHLILVLFEMFEFGVFAVLLSDCTLISASHPPEMHFYG